MAAITGKSIILYPNKQYLIFKSLGRGPQLVTTIEHKDGSIEKMYTELGSSGMVFNESESFLIPKGWMYNTQDSDNIECPLKKATIVTVSAETGPRYGYICCWDPRVTGYSVSGCGQSQRVSYGGSTTLCCNMECPTGECITISDMDIGDCGASVKRTSSNCVNVSNVHDYVSITFECRPCGGGGGGDSEPSDPRPQPPRPNPNPPRPNPNPPSPDPVPPIEPEIEPDPEPEPEPEPDPEPKPNYVVWKREGDTS